VFLLIPTIRADEVAAMGTTDILQPTHSTNADPSADLPNASRQRTSTSVIHQDDFLAEIVSDVDGSQRNQMEDEAGKIIEIKKDPKAPTDEWDVNAKTPQYPQISQKEFEALKIKAESGFVWAENNLGVMYSTGNGTVKNTTEAFKWYKKASEKGDSVAESNLGCMYEHGLGVDQDEKEAIKLFNKSADQGNLSALVNLAIAEKSKGNFPEAIRLFTIAGEKGNLAAALQLYSINASNDYNLTEAIKWLKIAAKLGDIESQFNLGFWYSTGRNGTISINLKEGLKWYKIAADNGDVQAQEFLPDDYYDLHDYKNAIINFNRLTFERLAPYQCYAIGWMYYCGKGVETNYTIAAKYFQKAADNGDANSLGYIGMMYATGRGLEKNFMQSFKCNLSSATKGSSYGQNNVAINYYLGEGVIKDKIESLAWYNIAASSDEEYVHNRDAIENEVGPAGVLAAQQRSKELLAIIKHNQSKQTQQSNPSTAENVTPTSSGSGVLITTDGLILTADHVVNGATQIDVQTPSGRFSAKVVQVDAANDVALIKINGSFKPSPIISSKNVQLGQSVFTIGYPNIDLQGYSQKLTKGEISSMDGVQDDPREWQISVPVQPGNSGGPLYDDKGNVIGIVLAKLNALKMVKYTGDVPENVGYAIKSSYILPLLDQYSSGLAPENHSTAQTVELAHKVSDSVVLILCSGSQ
jgi:TPR repeat protein/S1-C subfamily serine protease